MNHIIFDYIAHNDTKRLNDLLQTTTERGLLNIFNADGATPLQTAIKYEYKCTVQFLLKKGADVNFMDCIGANALHYAARCQFINVIEELLQAGAAITCDQRKSSPLHYAAYRNHHHILGQILYSERHASFPHLDGQNLSLNTPLHLAVRGGHYECAKVLINTGAKYNLYNICGLTAIDIAKSLSDKRLLKLFDEGA